MDRFKELQTFVAVADAGGFNAAGRKLQMSPPSVTRLVADLEARLGTRLFIRTTRQVALTEAGERLHQEAARILADLEAVEASAAGAHVAPQGLLTVTAPVMFGRKFLAPVVRDYLDHYPTVKARTLFVDRVVNLIDEGLDVALRIGDLPDSSLKAVRVGSVRRVAVAAPSYLKKHATPEKPADLNKHKTVLPYDLSPMPVWEFVSKGKRQSVNLKPAMTCNTIGVALDAALVGWGITRLLSYQVADALKSGDLVELLPEFEDRRLPIHLLHSETQFTAAKIRTFVDFARKALGKHAKKIEAV
ncbi:MAG: LysR family transcriptional regulator [Filomicrobium sp.]